MIFFHEKFKVGACPNLKDYMKGFYSYVQDRKHSVSPTFFRNGFECTSFWKKMIYHEIFLVGPCPNLKDSLLYERFSIHMNKALSIGIFNFALSATPLCCARYIFLEKDDFSGNLSSWCMAQLERYHII